MIIDLKSAIAFRDNDTPSIHMIDMLEGWQKLLAERAVDANESAASSISAEDVRELIQCARNERAREEGAQSLALDRQFTWRFMRERVLPLLCELPPEGDEG